MKKKQCVLVLTADAGFGHRNASNAIVEALEERFGVGCECVVLNPIFDRRTPFFIRDSQKDYDKNVRSHPAFYRLTYEISEWTVSTKILAKAFSILLASFMRALVEEVKPDVIVSTYHLFNAPLAAALSAGAHPAPFYAAVTDFMDVHPLWFHPALDGLFVASPAVRDQAVAWGIAPEKVFITGIPVSPKIAGERRSQRQVRIDLGWQPDGVTLLAVGSRRVDRMVSSLEAIDRCGCPLQLVVVTGGDDDLYLQLQAMQWRLPVRLYRYVENIPEMMQAADIVVSKAGGLIIAEGLACGLPLLLIDYIPAQETGNIDYVCQNQAGVFIRSASELPAVLESWLKEDGKLLSCYAENSRRLGKPGAASQVAQALSLALRAEADPSLP